MNKKSILISNLKKDFFRLNDEYDVLYNKIYYNRNDYSLIKKIDELFLTDSMVEFLFPYYFDNMDNILIERYIGDNEILWADLINVLSSRYEKPLSKYKINSLLLSKIMAIMTNSELSNGEYKYETYICDINYCYKTIITISYHKLLNDLILNPNLDCLTLRHIEEYYKRAITDNTHDIGLEEYKSKYIDKLINHPNYNKIASMILEIIK